MSRTFRVTLTVELPDEQLERLAEDMHRPTAYVRDELEFAAWNQLGKVTDATVEEVTEPC